MLEIRGSVLQVVMEAAQGAKGAGSRSLHFLRFAAASGPTPVSRPRPARELPAQPQIRLSQRPKIAPLFSLHCAGTRRANQAQVVLLCIYTPPATVIKMSGRGKGGKGLGKGGAKRHRKVLRDNIQGITVSAYWLAVKVLTQPSMPVSW
jgi:hypothetical protein